MNKEIEVSWSEIHKITEDLAENISKKHKIDNIVAIARGGVVPARYFAKLLKIRRIHTLGIEFYDDDIKRSFPIIYQGFTNNFKRSDVILIIDDIVDSGESMLTAIEEVKKHGTENIVTSSLHYKKKSSYVPHFYGKLVPDEVWIKYDWEN